MNITSYNRNVNNDGKILFPLLQSWNPMSEVATIAAQVNGKRVSCRISSKVLQKKFNASADEPMKAVTENRPHIEKAARRLIESDAYEQDGSIAIDYKDLD